MLKHNTLFFFLILIGFHSRAQDSLATVYFYNTANGNQAFENYIVFEGDRALGRLRKGNLFGTPCKTGTHTFSATGSGGSGSITVTVEAGVWYYINSDLRDGKATFEQIEYNSAFRDISNINSEIAGEMPAHRFSALLPKYDPNDSLATIFFYRTGNIAGAAVSYDVKHNEKTIGRSVIKSMFVYRCKPGVQTFKSKTESTSSIVMQVGAGRWYFVQCGVSVGVLVGKASFRQMSEAEAKADIAKIDPAMANTIPAGLSVIAVQNDTLRALTNLYQRKRKGGTTRAVVFGTIGVISAAATIAYTPTTVKAGSQVIPLESSPPAINYVLIGFSTIMMITGITQSAKYNSAAMEKALADYRDGKPLPPEIKMKFKKKDFD